MDFLGMNQFFLAGISSYLLSYQVSVHFHFAPSLSHTFCMVRAPSIIFSIPVPVPASSLTFSMHSLSELLDRTYSVSLVGSQFCW